MEQLDQQLEEIRTICRLHAVPTSTPRDLSNFPSRLSQDAGFRSDVSEIIRSFQAANSHLPDVLNTFVLAVGGKLSPAQTREVGESVNLLCGFLLSVGRWPDTDEEPVLAPGEIPSNLPNLIRPPSPGKNGYSTNLPGSPGNVHHDLAPSETLEPEREFANDAPEPGPSGLPAFAAADIVGALARLERGSFELRAHLESIDQRISRIEPLLELGAPPSASRDDHPATAAAPLPSSSRRTPLPKTWGAFSREDLFEAPDSQTNTFHVDTLRTDSLHADAFQTASLHADPLEFPTETAAIPPSSQTLGSNHNGVAGHDIRSETLSADPPPETRNFTRRSAPAPTVPRFSRYAVSEQPLEVPTPVTATAPASPAVEVVPPASPEPVLKPINLPHGFFGATTDPDAVAPGDLSPSGQTPPRRRSLLFAVASILLLILTAAGILFYLRFSSSAEDATPHASGITSLPAPRAPAEGVLPGPVAAKGPLTATPSKPSAASPEARVLGARRVFESHQSAEDLQTVNGFRPAGTFVPASAMEGRLLSAPLPDRLRISSDAGLQGLVILEANISPTGQVEDLNVLGGSKSLRSAAIETVRNWKYKPYLRNGVPVEVRTIVRVDFNSHKPQPAERTEPFPQ